MTTTALAPKIVSKALYLELVADDKNFDEAELRQLLGWQHGGTKQVVVFPEYQDDTGKVFGAVVLNRVISKNSPRAQWDFTYMDRVRPKPAEDSDNHYVNYPTYKNSEWDLLTAKEKFDSAKRGLEIVLKGMVVTTTYGLPDAEGRRETVAKQGWIVRESKPISVELTDEDMAELHLKGKTPQAVVRRINKVRESLDKFPTKLA